MHVQRTAMRVLSEIALRPYWLGKYRSYRNGYFHLVATPDTRTSRIRRRSRAAVLVHVLTSIGIRRSKERRNACREDSVPLALVQIIAHHWGDDHICCSDCGAKRVNRFLYYPRKYSQTCGVWTSHTLMMETDKRFGIWRLSRVIPGGPSAWNYEGSLTFHKPDLWFYFSEVRTSKWIRTCIWYCLNKTKSANTWGRIILLPSEVATAKSCPIISGSTMYDALWSMLTTKQGRILWKYRPTVSGWISNGNINLNYSARTRTFP